MTGEAERFGDILQKIVNDPKDMVDEAVYGFICANPQAVCKVEDRRVVKYVGAPVEGKVGIISGGGSGHEPAFLGYVGKNMLDAVAIGDIFKTPLVEDYYAAIKAADSGKGVLCLYGNYKNDIVNVEKAIELASADGIKVKTVIANDDVAQTELSEKRGLTGEVLLWKIGGAAAAAGYDIDETERVCRKAVGQMASIGIGLSSCIIPTEGRPNYLIEAGTMEIGVGHHGLASMDTCKLRTGNEIADIMIRELEKEFTLSEGEELTVVVSGLGNTMLSELNLLFGRIYNRLTEKDVKIYKAMVGNFFTSLDMMGVTLTFMRMDEELKRLFAMPAYSPAWGMFNK